MTETNRCSQRLGVHPWNPNAFEAELMAAANDALDRWAGDVVLGDRTVLKVVRAIVKAIDATATPDPTPLAVAGDMTVDMTVKQDDWTQRRD